LPQYPHEKLEREEEKQIFPEISFVICGTIHTRIQLTRRGDTKRISSFFPLLVFFLDLVQD
jgi:hypothetical protein